MDASFKESLPPLSGIMDCRVKPTAVRFDFAGQAAWHGFF
jgi:hypothetical protein